MEETIFCCKECKECIDLLSDIKNIGTSEWCRNLNIPLLDSEDSICDGFKLKKRTLNAWNFRKIKDTAEDSKTCDECVHNTVVTEYPKFCIENKEYTKSRQVACEKFEECKSEEEK